LSLKLKMDGNMNKNRINKTSYEKIKEKYTNLIEKMKLRFLKNQSTSFDAVNELDAEDPFWTDLFVSFISNDAVLEEALLSRKEYLLEKSNRLFSLIYSTYATYICGGNIYHISEELLCLMSETKILLDLEGIVMPYDNFYINFPKNILKTTMENSDGHHSANISGCFISCGINKETGNRSIKYHTVIEDKSGSIFMQKINSYWGFNGSFDLIKYNSENSFLDEYVKNVAKSTEVDNSEEFLRIQKIILNIILYLISEKSDLKMVKKVDSNLRINPKKRKKQDVCRLPYTIIGGRINHVILNDFDTKGSVPRFKLNYRMFVSGHTKKQWYGPGRKNWKIISILPYIKGPEGSGVKERNYKVV